MIKVRKLSPEEATAFRDEWLQTVQDMIALVRGWAENRGWISEEERHEVREERLGTYDVPVLGIDTPHGRLVFEPIAREVIGAEGRIDLYAWPSLFRVMLLRKSDMSWIVRTDSGVNWPNPWNEKTFGELALGLLGEQ
jgi:hypothetical protein